MRSRAVSQSQIEWPAPTSASAFCSASLIRPCASAPPAKACCMMVKAISITISTSPPASAGCTTECSMRPVTASHAAATQKSRMIQVGISMIARSKPRIASQRMTPSPTAAVSAEREARDAGRDARIDGDDAGEQRQAEQPEHRDVAVADVPAMEMQVGVEEDEERAGEHHLRRRRARSPCGRSRPGTRGSRSRSRWRYRRSTAQASAAVAGNIAVPLTTKSTLRKSASSPAIPSTTPR